MARGLAPLTVLVLLFGCFKAGGDDDEIGATEDTGDTTEESTSESTSEDSTSEDSTEDSTEDTTTGPDCGPGEMACGQDCTDLDNDPDHCGACDHSCLGGECVSGTCQAVELANSKGRLFMVVVDDDHLYYGGDGVDVGRMDKDGGNDTILITAGADPMMNEYCYDWALTPFAVVWGNDWLQPGVRGCVLPDCEGGVQTFVPGLNLFGMTYHEDSATLYWNQGDEIHQRTWPGGTPSVFLGMAGNPRSMTTDDAFVYWTAALAANDAHLRKSPLDGGPFVELAIDRPDAGDIEVGPDFIYWAEGSQIYFAPLPNGIGGGAPPPFGSSGTTVRRTAIDDTHLYWTSTSMDIGTIQRCPLDGCAGAPEVLGQSQQPWGITLDQDAVYWVTEQGSIFKVAK